MSHSSENMNKLKQMTVEMIKSTKRILEVNLELIKSDEFIQALYGEGLAIEEELNQYQIKIDEKAVETIARFQPTAKDLRLIVGIMKINTDLERVGDHCINILKTIKRAFKDKGELSKEMVPINDMGEKVQNMFNLFMDGYLNEKVENGYIVLGLDSEIDEMKEKHIIMIKDSISCNVNCLELGIENLLISRNYERIADQITNLAESLIYILKGEDLRHKRGTPEEKK